MPTGMHATMRTELKEHPNRVYETLALTIQGNVFRYSTGGGVLRNASQPVFEPGLTRGPITRRMPWPSFGLEPPRVTYQVYDETRDLQKLLGGLAQGAVKGGTANHRMRSDFVDAANHFQLVNGIIKDHRMIRERVYEFVVGPDTDPLESKLKIPILSRDIWPKIPVENEDLPGACFLGEWLSPGVPGASGMVEAILVDDEQGLWYVSYGIMGDITNIQVDGDSDTDFTILGTGAAALGPYVQAGRPYTLLQDTAGTLRTIANTVTCDVIGPEKQGDGSESTGLLDEPARMLRIALANFVYNDYPVGAPTPTAGSWAWFSQASSDANTPVDDASNTTADTDFFDAHNVTAAMMLTSDDTGNDVIRTWAETFKCPVAWEIPFNIHTLPIRIDQRDPYPTEQVSKFLRQVQRAEERSVGDDVVTAHRTSYIFNSAAGQFAKMRVDANRFCAKKIETPFEFTYGPAEAV